MFIRNKSGDMDITKIIFLVVALFIAFFITKRFVGVAQHYGNSTDNAQNSVDNELNSLGGLQ